LLVDGSKFGSGFTPTATARAGKRRGYVREYLMVT
jgi:hypothetical protein